MYKMLENSPFDEFRGARGKLTRYSVAEKPGCELRPRGKGIASRSVRVEKRHEERRKHEEELNARLPQRSSGTGVVAVRHECGRQPAQARQGWESWTRRLWPEANPVSRGRGYTHFQGVVLLPAPSSTSLRRLRCLQSRWRQSLCLHDQSRHGTSAYVRGVSPSNVEQTGVQQGVSS